MINLVLAFFKSSCKIEKLCPYYQIKYSSSCLVNISGHNEGKCFGNVFRSGSLTWPKMSGSWGKQKNALYQTLSLSLTSPTSDLIFQTVQCQDKGKKIPLVFFVMQIKYVIPLPDQKCFYSVQILSIGRKFHQGIPRFSQISFVIAQGNTYLQSESTSTSKAKKKNTTQTKKLYQVEVLSQSIRVPILIQLQQNTLNGLFLNTATKCVKKCVINICTPFSSHCLRQTHLPFLNSKTFFCLVLQMTGASFISSLIQAHCSSKPNWASSITTASMIIMTSFLKKNKQTKQPLPPQRSGLL